MQIDFQCKVFQFHTFHQLTHCKLRTLKFSFFFLSKALNKKKKKKYKKGKKKLNENINNNSTTTGSNETKLKDFIQFLLHKIRCRYHKMRYTLSLNFPNKILFAINYR